jgi:hypothetical protein
MRQKYEFYSKKALKPLNPTTANQSQTYKIFSAPQKPISDPIILQVAHV